MLNVVEEMAIAAAIPTPRVLLLYEDHSINALALLQRGENSIVGVTAGASDKLSRDELQALIGHEIAHIANGDAAINIRLLALIQGFRWIYDASVAAMRIVLNLITGIQALVGIGDLLWHSSWRVTASPHPGLSLASVCNWPF